MALLGLLYSSAHDTRGQERRAKVCIIGAGIAGGSTSHFLQQFLKESGQQPADITVFDRNDYIGGRLKHIEFGDDKLIVEVGGAAWANDNHWMAHMAKELNINVTSGNSDNEKVAKSKIWQGDGFAPAFKLVKEDEPMTRKVLGAEAEFFRDINKNYEKQVNSAPFTSVGVFLQFGEMVKYTCDTVLNFFTSRDVDQEYIETELVPLNRAIYNQGSDANAFSLLASLDALLSQISVAEGNSHMVEVLFESTGAHVELSTSVSKIAKQDDGTYTVTTSTPSGDASNVEGFDVVFIAAPLEQTDIEMVNIDVPSQAKLNRHYFDWYIHVVQADSVNPAQFKPYYNAPHRPTPSLILTTTNSSSNKNTPWIMIEPLGKHAQSGDASTTDGVWLLYSDHSQTANLDKYFVNVADSYEQYWPYTFPTLVPIEGDEDEVQPIVLDPKGAVYNINAMESLATAMEMSSIGGRNAARMASDFLQSRVSL